MVKGNFVLGTNENGNPRTVIMIDYGLSREHLTPAGVVKPERKEARWVGSRRYMSLNTHYRVSSETLLFPTHHRPKRDQARRDDLWSLLYVIIEFRLGTLPWAHLRGPENFVSSEKKSFLTYFSRIGFVT